MKSIVGRKMGMTQVFAKDGTMYPVTVVEVLPNVVLQVKTMETDGYNAIKVGYEDKKASRCNKAELGQFYKKEINPETKEVVSKEEICTPKYEVKEIHNDEIAYKVGDEIKVDIFAAGDVVDVIGTSKGRGFLGAVQRYGYKIGPKGHGSGYHRGSGSFATNGRTNNRVHPGKKSAGHEGNERVTIQNLTIVSVDAEHNAILVKGAVPGPKKSIVVLKSAAKASLVKPNIKELVNYSAPKAE